MLSGEAVTLDQLNSLLAAHEFTRRPGFRVSSLGAGECGLAVPYSPEYDRPGGIVSGQLFMHAADVAFWLAIKTRLGLEDGSVTSGMTTAFLGSAHRGLQLPGPDPSPGPAPDLRGGRVRGG